MNEMCSNYGGAVEPNVKRVRCPKCGRRVMVQSFTDEDGHEVRRMPRHKVKGWYKKPKPKRKERRHVR